MAFTINNMQEQPLIAQGFDAGGTSLNMAPYAKTWSSDNTAVVVTGQAPDGNQVAAAVPGATGSANVTLHVTRTDGTIASASVPVTVVAAPPPVPATVAIASGGYQPRTRSLP